MDKKQEAFLLELINDFKIEAAEHQQAIVNCLLELEKKPPSPDYKELVETTFREFHNLKGSARAVNLLDIERLCQSLEGVFHKLKQGSLTLLPSSFDMLYKANDSLNVMLSEIDKTHKSIGANALAQLIQEVETMQKSIGITQKMNFPTPPLVSAANNIAPLSVNETTLDFNTAKFPINETQAAKDTVRVATSKLDILLRQAEEFITVKATMAFYIQEIKKKKHDDLCMLVKDMEQFHVGLSRMVDNLLFDIKTTLLHPFSSLLAIVPKIVRDLGKEYNKEIQLSIRGGEIEIDRRILEEIKDPLIHLIRNCIDHGIEIPDIRQKKGKSATGLIEISVKQESGKNVELCIHDDGAGINKTKVISAAVKMGITSMEAAAHMSDRDICGFIFRSGISTSQFITDISGRGLGMAIVADKIANLGGTIMVESPTDEGTTFTITLPVTLATFRGILVRINESFFIVPTNSIESAVRVHQDEVRSVESKKMILMHGESIALVRLGDVLSVVGRKIRNKDEKTFPVLILSLAQKRIALMIDEVLGEHEGLVKDLGPQLIHVRNIAGVTVMGNGRVVPILQIHELMESAIHAAEADIGLETADEAGVKESELLSILVADDSITSRSLLRDIIESSGFLVKTAVDGLEAFQFLQNEKFDLLVSDVEMPKMNGFELTARIKEDTNLSEIPVVLVTALESADDRQKGMDAGANAYIIKSSFEQSNLIETIRRLI